MATINLRDVPDELHKRFKVLCAERDTNIKAEILRLIEREVAGGHRKR